MKAPEKSSVSEDDQASPVEQVAPNLTRHWLFDRQIVVFTPTSVARPVVDAWIDSVKATMESWPEERPYLAIHDFTHKTVSLTPYARSRAEELIPLSAKAPGYAAILLPRTFVAQIIRLFIRSQRRQGNQNEVFFTMADAIAWLKPKLGQRPATARK